MNILFILNDAPNEAGRSLNALRLACSLSMRSTVYVRIFLIGEAIACARRDSVLRAGPDDTRALVAAVLKRGGDVRVCGACTGDEDNRTCELIEGVTPSSLGELSRWVCEADRLLVF